MEGVKKLVNPPQRRLVNNRGIAVTAISGGSRSQSIILNIINRSVRLGILNSEQIPFHCIVHLIDQVINAVCVCHSAVILMSGNL